MHTKRNLYNVRNESIWEEHTYGQATTVHMQNEVQIQLECGLKRSYHIASTNPLGARGEMLACYIMRKTEDTEYTIDHRT